MLPIFKFDLQQELISLRLLASSRRKAAVKAFNAVKILPRASRTTPALPPISPRVIPSSGRS